MKVIFDTNVLISFLAGKRLSFIKEYISDARITVIISEQLIKEIEDVTQRKQLKKYFPQKSVCELLNLFDTIAKKFEINPTNFMCRDPKDNFLLDLIDVSMADYLVTGDKDLLALNPFKTAKILTPADFEKMMIDLQG
jgi:putative PIN family toxin of toxin-antitoxin system